MVPSDALTVNGQIRRGSRRGSRHSGRRVADARARVDEQRVLARGGRGRR